MIRQATLRKECFSFVIITNMKTTSKSKPQTPKPKNRKLLIVFGAALALVVMLFLFRGWARMTVLPNTVEAVYSNSVQKVYQDEMNKLQDPLALLGYHVTLPADAHCYTVVANGVKTQVDCSYGYDVSRETPTDMEAKRALNANVEKLQALLQANGWQGEYSNDGQPYSSLVKLVSSITSGIDYQPDATYLKQIGNIECIFGNNTAFSHPNPAQMTTRISCSKSINILGQPSWN
jgi:hypothetical protein